MFYKKLLSDRKKILLAIFSFAAIISIALVFFVTRPAFLKTAAVYAGRLAGMRIEIGSISITDRHRVVIERLSLENEEDGFSLAVPYAEVNFTLKGLLRKNIEGLTVRAPKLSFAIKKDAQGRISLPFTFNALSISDADVTINSEDSAPLHISPVTLTLIKQPDGKYGDLQGNVFINGLNATVSLASEIDMKTFDFKKIQVDMSPVNLKDASGQYPLSLLKLAKLQGTCSLNMAMERDFTAKEKSMSWHADADFDDLLVISGHAGIELKSVPLRLSANGRYITKGDVISIDSFAADLAGLNILKLHGTIAQMRSAAPDIDITAKVSTSVQRMKEILHSPPDWLAETDTDGTINGDISVSGSYAAPQIRGVAGLQGKMLSFGNSALKSFSVRFPFEYGEGSLLVKKASIQAEEAAIKSMDIKDNSRFISTGLKLDISSLSYKNSLLLAENIELHAGSAVLFRDGKEYFTEKDILIRGDMDGDITGQLFKVKNILIDAGFFKGLAASADISTGGPVKVNAGLSYISFALEELSRAFPHNIFTEKGYTISGKGALKMTARMVIPEKGASQISGTAGVELTDAGLSSADGSVICEGIRMSVSSKFESSSLPNGPLSFSAETEAGGFELLAGKFYGSFKDRPISISASGEYTGKNDTLRINNAKAGLRGIGEIVISGLLSDISNVPYFDVSVQVPYISNSEAFDFLVRETFQEQLPILSGLRISGRSLLNLNVKGTKENYTVDGDMRIEDMNISDGTEERSVSGVQVSLPINLVYPEPLHDMEVKSFGSITIKDLSWAAFKLKDIALSPSLWQNDIILKEDVRIPLYGGEVVLKKISYGSIFADGQKLLLSVDINDLDLEKASAALQLPKFSGSLSGVIPQARFQNNTLFTDGEMELELFGGNMKINGLSADNVFSPAPSLKAGIKFDDIDLGRLTGVFDFGHISGVMRGEITELVIVNGQAQHFRATIETYKKKGFEQKISVEALKKISILGAGTSTSILDRGIYQFFKEYGYRKIGFSAYLKNDKLLLIGVQDGGDERYLVKGSLLPPKVNVISYNQNISFKEMVSRLKRITAADK